MLTIQPFYLFFLTTAYYQGAVLVCDSYAVMVHERTYVFSILCTGGCNRRLFMYPVLVPEDLIGSVRFADYEDKGIYISRPGFLVGKTHRISEPGGRGP